MGQSVFDFTQLFSKAKERCSRQALTRDPLSFDASFLENSREYPRKPCITRNYRISAEDLRR